MSKQVARQMAIFAIKKQILSYQKTSDLKHDSDEIIEELQNIIDQIEQAIKDNLDTSGAKSGEKFLREVYETCLGIFEDTNLDWEAKYDKIFSIRKEYCVNFDYYDPDTTYEEDVTAFMNAFKEKIEQYGN